MTLPLFIISRDRLEPLQKLLAWLANFNEVSPIIVDNASTYAPLLDYLNGSRYEVIRLDENVGHTAPWARNLIPSDGPYLVTDPDVLPDPSCPPDVFRRLAQLLDEFPEAQKAGLALRTDDLPEHYSLRREVQRWEAQFWTKPRVHALEVYEATIDTTLAVYRPGTQYDGGGAKALRLAGPYTARHLSWYQDSANPTEEERYYYEHANKDITSWTGPDLPSRYPVYLEG